MPPESLPDWSPSEVAGRFDVSRETLDRLRAYVDLLRRWTRRINLVSPASLNQVWKRHIGDSLQLVALGSGRTGVWADLGSGAGLPGLVVAIAGDRPVTLVESDRRKGAFLREAARVTGARIDLVSRRIEAAAPLSAEVLTARALAPLPRLLELASPHMAESGTGLFLKGLDVDDELTAAAKYWKMHVKLIPSMVDDTGQIVVVSKLERR